MSYQGLDWDNPSSWTVEQLIVEALLTDGAHHKQWFLFSIADRLGIDLKTAIPKGYEAEEGIAP